MYLELGFKIAWRVRIGIGDKLGDGYMGLHYTVLSASVQLENVHNKSKKSKTHQLSQWSAQISSVSEFNLGLWSILLKSPG